MAGITTFTIIKPDAYEGGHTGTILKMIEEAGFIIKAAKLTKLNKERAGQFYAVHKDKSFYDDLVAYMSSCPVLVAVLKKDNAVEDFRKLIGATSPDEAAEGTIRKLFARSVSANAIHGSDSDENAEIETGFFFSRIELY